MCRDCRRQRPKDALASWRRIAPERIKTCAYADCGKRFVARTASQQTCCRSCGQKVRNGVASEEQRKAAERERYQRKCRRRRVLQQGGKAEPYTLAEIAKRDGYRCGVCRRKVNMRLVDGRLPMAPTIDHVVPVSEGGDDTKANVRLTHRRCNTSRGARGGGEQLRLVG